MKKMKQDKLIAGRSISEILRRFDKKIKDKWDDTFENGKCIKCSMMCGASSQIDHSRLYENIE